VKLKIDAYSHQEANVGQTQTDWERMFAAVANGEDVLHDFCAIDLDDSFPKYLLDNRDYFKRYIAPVDRAALGRSLNRLTREYQSLSGRRRR
jgi:hypothetical protein